MAQRLSTGTRLGISLPPTPFNGDAQACSDLYPTLVECCSRYRHHKQAYSETSTASASKVLLTQRIVVVTGYVLQATEHIVFSVEFHHCTATWNH